jgi:putative transposase
MIQSAWNEIPAFYPGVETDGFVAMPNHVHGIIVLIGAAPCGRPDPGQAREPAPTLSLADVVHAETENTTVVRERANPARFR